MKRLLLAIGVLLALVNLCRARGPNLHIWLNGPFERGFYAYKEGRYSTALEYWLPLAQAGDSRAQRRVGGMYEHGLGVPQDVKKAVNGSAKPPIKAMPRGRPSSASCTRRAKAWPKTTDKPCSGFRKPPLKARQEPTHCSVTCIQEAAGFRRMLRKLRTIPQSRRAGQQSRAAGRCRRANCARICVSQRKWRSAGLQASA